MFNVDFKKLIIDSLRSRYRKVGFLKALEAFVSPLESTKKSLIEFRSANLRDLSYNGQVISLEKMLNDYFDPKDRRIYIQDGTTRDNVYVHKLDEQEPLFVSDLFIHKDVEYNDSGEDFIIVITNAIFLTQQKLIELKALVNRYKLVSMRFKIVRE